MLRKRINPNNSIMSGFTMSEVLITLGILAIVYSITVPIITGRVKEHSNKKDVFRETIDTVYTIMARGLGSGELRYDRGDADINFQTYFLSQINASKVCPNNSLTEGCWNWSAQYNGPPMNSRNRWGQDGVGVVLHTGAVIVGLEKGQCPGCHASAEYLNMDWNLILIDWNGEKPPNAIGRDQLYLMICYNGTKTCSTADITSPIYYTTPIKLGMGQPWNDLQNTQFWQDNKKLFNWIYEK